MPSDKQKNLGGKPLKFKSPEDMQALINQYFQKPEIIDKTEIPDVEGLCYFLDTSRKVLMEYEERDGYGNAIKSAKTRIAACKKQLGMQGKIPPAIFCFDFKNNHGYVDKQEVAHTGADGQPLTVIVHRGSDLTALPEPVEQIENAQVLDHQESAED